MQGIIASLLALMMTGMVIGQQPQNNFPPGQAANRTQPREYLLIVDQGVIQSLKTHGSLTTHHFKSAKNDNGDSNVRNDVEHIVFNSSETNARRSDIEVVGIQPLPPVDGDNTLVFELNDRWLDLLQRKELRYMLRPQDIGRFDTLTVKYDSPNRSRTQSSTVTQSVTRRPLAADRNVNPVAAPRTARNPIRNDNDRYFGPSLPPDDWQSRQNQQQRQTAQQPRQLTQQPRQTTQQTRQLTQQPRQITQQPRQTAQQDRRTTENDDSFRPRLGTIATRRDNMFNRENQRKDLYPIDDRDDRSLDTRQPRVRQQDQVAYDDRRIDRQQLNRQNLFDRQNFDLSNERTASNTPFDTRTFRSENQLPRIDDRQTQRQAYDPVLEKELVLRDAENRSLDRVNQSLEGEVEALRRRLQDEQTANRRDRFAIQDRRDPRATAYDREYDYLYAPRDRVRQRGYNDQVIVQPPINTQPMPDRLAVAPRPTNRLMPFAIEGPGNNNTANQQAGRQPNGPATPAMLADSERYKKQNAALWFIMLCSVGMNFYLSWIARGFYVRYEELADDIRETFTSSM